MSAVKSAPREGEQLPPRRCDLCGGYFFPQFDFSTACKRCMATEREWQQRMKGKNYWPTPTIIES